MGYEKLFRCLHLLLFFITLLIPFSIYMLVLNKISLTVFLFLMISGVIVVVVMYQNVIPYWYYKVYFKELKTLTGNSGEYYPSGFKFMKGLQTKVPSEAKTIQEFDPFMPAFIYQKKDIDVVINLQKIIVSHKMVYQIMHGWWRYQLRIKIVKNNNIEKKQGVFLENKERESETEIESRIRKLYKNVGLDKMGYVGINSTGVEIIYSGFHKNHKEVTRWIELSNQLFDEVGMDDEE